MPEGVGAIAEIASAFVSILPSTRGFGTALDGQVSGDVATSGKRNGAIFGKALASGIALAGVAVIAAVKGLYEAGSVIDESQDAIRTSTGKTGAALDSLNKSVQNVARTAPVAFALIAPVVADLNRRLGLTGKPLEKLSQQFLDLGHITGEEVDIDSVTGALNLFGVKGDQVSKVMDQLFRVSQSTGVSFNELVSSLQRNGANLTQFGFSVSESASLIGTLDKAGIDSNKTLATLSKAMVTFAKDGAKPRAALLGTIAQVQDLVKAGDQAGAVNLASKVFGTRGASQFIAAIRSGRLNVDQLTAATKGNTDTIVGATKDTADFAEQWQLFKNNVLVALIPLATRVFNAVGSVGASLNTSLLPTFRSLFASVQSGNGTVGRFAGALQTLGSYIQTTVLPVIKGALIEALAAGKSAFNQIRKAVEDNKPEMQQLANAAKQIASVLITRVIPASVKAAATLVRILGIAIGGTVRAISVMVSAFNRAKAAMATVKNAIAALASGVAGAVSNMIGKFTQFATAVRQKISNAITTVKGLPGKIKAAVGDLGTLLVRAGEQIIEGLIKGIGNKLGALGTKLGAVGGFIKSHKGPPAKDKAMLVGAGQMIMDGLIQGISSREEVLGKKLDKVGKKIADKMKAAVDKATQTLTDRRDTLQGLFDGIASGVTSNLGVNVFDGVKTAAQFVGSLLNAKSGMNNLLAAFNTLKGYGLDPGFLSQLFQSGGADLILSLAAGGQDQAATAASLFGDVNGLTADLSNRVAKNDPVSDRLDTTNSLLTQLVSATGKTAYDLAEAVNNPAKKARKRAKKR